VTDRVIAYGVFVVVAALTAFVSWAFIAMFYEMHVTSRCFEAGYAGGRVSVTLDAYCYKRVNGTDVVVPLSGVE
jgi:hypothetical protein